MERPDCARVVVARMDQKKRAADSAAPDKPAKHVKVSETVAVSAGTSTTAASTAAAAKADTPQGTTSAPVIDESEVKADQEALETLRTLVAPLRQISSEAGPQRAQVFLQKSQSLLDDMADDAEVPVEFASATGLDQWRTDNYAEGRFGPEQDDDDDVDGLSHLSNFPLGINTAPMSAERVALDVIPDTLTDGAEDEFDDKHTAVAGQIAACLRARSTNRVVYAYRQVHGGACRYRQGVVVLTKAGRWLGFYFDDVVLT